MVNGRPNKQHSAAQQVSPAAQLAIIGTTLTVVWVIAAAWLSAQLAGVGQGNPVEWVSGQQEGSRWSDAATGWAMLFGLLTAVVVALLTFVAVRTAKSREWTDSLASSMHSRRDLKEMLEKNAVKDARRLGCEEAGPGLVLGKAVLTHEWLYGLWEWSQIWIMGTRAGKSRSVAIPQLMTHHGAAISTSNKRDLVDRTRGRRSELGNVWINDPQRIAKQRATWYWDVIKFVTSLERAHKLVEVWSAARSSADMAGQDPYFEPEGRKLTASLLVAARLGNQPVERLSDWVTGKPPAPGVPDPCDFLEAGGYATMARNIRSWLALDDGQRDGVYGTARSYLGFLDDPRFVRWISATGGDDRPKLLRMLSKVKKGPAGDRPEFDPEAFVRSHDTLYLLSKEGAGSARAITAALTMAVYQTAEDYAEQCGDRVPTPILFLLDEAANVCRWPELPSLYSHAGGKGIILVTILQSRRQGEKAWGENEFEMMWSAANLAVAGRGINDHDHLSGLRELIGQRQVRDGSVTTGRAHKSRSLNNREEHIFDESDLRALPRGRAVLFASGARSILLELIDYSKYTEWAWKCAESVKAFGPGGTEAGPMDDPDALKPLTDEELATYQAAADAAAAVEVPDELAVTAAGDGEPELRTVDVDELIKAGLDEVSPYTHRRLAAAGRRP